VTGFSKASRINPFPCSPNDNSFERKETYESFINLGFPEENSFLFTSKQDRVTITSWSQLPAACRPPMGHGSLWPVNGATRVRIVKDPYKGTQLQTWGLSIHVRAMLFLLTPDVLTA
jgi:hypothetical protein